MQKQKSNTGAAFADYILTEKIPKRRYNNKHDVDNDGSFRIMLLPVIIVSFVIILLVRLFYLQIIQGSYYRTLSDTNRTRTTIIHAPRGILFDRSKTPLVFNVPGFRQKIGDKISFLSQKQALQLIATGSANLEIDNLRQYPFANSFAHVLGYTGEVTREELDDNAFLSYTAGDILGKSGIEKEYEAKLRGVDGKKLIEVDATGKEIRTLGQKDPLPGNDITLTLDAKLQLVAYNALKDIKKGVVIAATPKGEILTLVSKPSFDPNLFTLGKEYKVASDEAYQTIGAMLTDGNNQPLLNRAISGLYPPGSTFKLITAAAGLEGKIVDGKFTIKDTGILRVGEFSFANWYFTNYGKTDGDVNIVKAIKRSNDIYFYILADKIGVEKLSLMARNFGLGQQLGIDLEGEAKGLVPTKAWKEKVIGESWYLGDNYHYGIGQGYLLTTPLQVNVWTQAIANGGEIYKPYLLKDSKAEMRNSKFLSEKTLSFIKQGMKESCATTGVAWPFFDFNVKNPKLEIDNKNFFAAKVASTAAIASSSAKLKDYRYIQVACKTGTAQHGDEKTMPHSWITLYAPAENPQIVLTVLAESSGEGSSVAGPIARKILEEWFSR